MFENNLKQNVIINSFTNQNNKVDYCEIFTKQSLKLISKPNRELITKPDTCKNEESMKCLKMEIELLRTINANLYKFTVNKIIDGNSFETQSNKMANNRIKISNSGVSLVKKSHRSVTGIKSNPSLINGFSEHNKKLKKKNKKQNKKNKPVTSTITSNNY